MIHQLKIMGSYASYSSSGSYYSTSSINQLKKIFAYIIVLYI